MVNCNIIKGKGKKSTPRQILQQHCHKGTKFNYRDNDVSPTAEEEKVLSLLMA